MSRATPSSRDSAPVKVTVLAETYLKRQIAPGAELPSSDRLKVPAGTVLQALQTAQDKNQHLWLKLADPLTAEDGTSTLTEIYGYDPHLEVEGEKLVLRLPVTYRSQMNNNPTWHGSPQRQCNVTSTVMMLDYVLDGRLAKMSAEGGFREPESYYGKILKQKYNGDTTDHDAHTRCLRDEFGVESYWSRSLSAQDIRRQLELNIPVVIGVAFKVSGHILCLVGLDETRGIYSVHDPYGIRFGASDRYDVGAWGAYDVYSMALMDKLFWDGGPEAGWGRIITKVGGQDTGMPWGL